MEDILPPEAGLEVNGLIYRYTTEKDPGSDMQVHIQNEHAIEDGYIIRNTDDWSQLPGSTINNMVLFPGIPTELIGQGSMEVEGEGDIIDPSVQYSYKFDECYIVLSNPECPGFAQALYDWLLENDLLGKEPEIGDPFYDEWVQLSLKNEDDVEDEEEKVEVENEEEQSEDAISALNADVDIEGFVDGARQSAIMQSFATIPKFDGYYAANISGGVYEDVLTLEDNVIIDNQRALNNLSQDNVHRNMVRSQYENN